jgi:hypothetical protein
MMNMKKRTLLGLLALSTLLPLATAAAPVDDAVAELQRDWEVIRYQTPAAEREKRFEALAARAHQASERFPGRAEPLVWEGIIVSSWAGEKGGLGALSLAKQAKAMYEAVDRDRRPARSTDRPTTAWGSCTTRCPAGRSASATRTRQRDLIQKALAINPKGIDPNFFYGEFLIETKHPEEAVTYLETRAAGAAAARPPDRRRRAPRGDPRAAREDQVALTAHAGASTTFMPRPSARGLKVGSRPCSAAMRLTIDTPRPLPPSCWPASRWKRSPRRES